MKKKKMKMRGMREMKNDVRTWSLIWPVTYRGERNVALFVWPKIIVVKMWVPRYGPIAQCFKHKGTFALMYIIMHHHFYKLEKIIYKN